MKTSAGATNNAIWSEDPVVISMVTSTWSRMANITAELCSAALPMIGTRMRPTNSRESPRSSSAGSRDRTSSSDSRATRAVDISRTPMDQRTDLVALFVGPGDLDHVLVGDEGEHEHGAVQEDEDARYDAAHHLALEQRVSPGREDEQRGHQKAGNGRRRVHRGGLGTETLEVVPQAPDEQRHAEDEQEVAQDRSGQGGLHDLDLVPKDEQDRDDQLRDVPERRVEQPSSTRTGVDRELLRRASDQCGEGRKDRERGGEEDRGLLLPEAQGEETGMKMRSHSSLGFVTTSRARSPFAGIG